MTFFASLNQFNSGEICRKPLLCQFPYTPRWIQPASGDAGSALGAGLVGWHQHQEQERVVNTNDSMKGTYLGPEFSNDDITKYLEKINAPFHTHSEPELFERLAEELEKGHVIGWFNCPMEFGPRALGGRSIIGDPRNQKMQSVMNLKSSIGRVSDPLHHRFWNKTSAISLK